MFATGTDKQTAQWEVVTLLAVDGKLGAVTPQCLLDALKQNCIHNRSEATLHNVTERADMASVERVAQQLAPMGKRDMLTVPLAKTVFF
ncbi:MAG: hypothetical protein PHC53_01740 [Patescibacteria group bacterium]|nr:hypothetical protein [Patescibacteria group bacterium]